MPHAAVLEDADGDVLAIDLHPAFGELSFEAENVEVVQPEAPVTFSQVQTWFRYQATQEQKRELLREHGEREQYPGERKTRPDTKNRRVQVDFRALWRDQSTQAQLRPRVTRLPEGGIGIEAADFSFRHTGAVTEAELDF